MTYRLGILTGLVLATAAVAGGLFFSGVFTTQAIQAPKMSLDMDPSGNTVSAGPGSINLMTVGTIDQCATTNPGTINPGPFPPAPTYSTQLIVEDVEDLVGWQARFNYDGTLINLSSFNEKPFTSVINSADIGFTNLPFDLIGGVHRGTTAASGTMNPGLATETTVIGASYLGTNTAPVSADTPYIGDEGTQTYDAPSGGVLAEVIWTIKPAADNNPTIHLDLDDNTPNAPGSQVVFFTGSGTDTLNLAESALFDGFLGVNTTCVAPALPTATATSTATSAATTTATSTPTPTPTATPTPVPQPPNDNFADARLVTQGELPFSDSKDIVGATIEPGEPFGCKFLDKTVWYKFSPSSGQEIRTNTTGSDVPEPFINVYSAPDSAPIGDLAFETCGSSISFHPNGNLTYYFQVGDGYGTTSGTLVFNLDQGTHDARVRRISSPFRILGMGDPDLATVDATIRNEGSHGDTIGLYLDAIPPGGPSNPGGCIPAGRILATTAFLDTNKQLRLFADTGTLGDGKVEFTCTNKAAVVGLPYTIVAAADVHADDAAACGPGLLLSLACFSALADDDTDPFDNRIVRTAPRVQ